MSGAYLPDCLPGNDTVIPHYGFPRTLRLLKPGEFSNVFNDAQYKASHQGIVLLARSNELGTPRLGFVFSKRNIKLATNRNRVKRVIRERLRLMQHDLAAIDMVAIARRPLAEMDNTSIRQMTDYLMLKLVRQYEKKTGAIKSEKTS